MNISSLSLLNKVCEHENTAFIKNPDRITRVTFC